MDDFDEPYKVPDIDERLNALEKKVQWILDYLNGKAWKDVKS